MYPFFFDPTMIILIPAIILSLYAQIKVQSAFERYSRVPSSCGLTGAEVAERLLRSSGINDVRIERIPNVLGDHYDPRHKVLRLSPGVYNSTSLAALGVAAHEAGHAIQHDVGYFPLELRSSLVPVAQFGSMAAFPILLIGILLGSPFLAKLGVYAFTGVVLFQLVTLPVEYNASSRAIALLQANGFISGQEAEHTKKVLDAAALTYLAAAVAAVLSLLRLLMISRMFGGDE
ncbi:MAG TPA: peptidase [Peptococcaceae bacterium]|nr:MAG: Peptidase membrane zinc metallopeptidase putative [Clostridia bacterium 41_269]HBT20054.1 peptidase [Peptococcaceae bacterium]